MDEQKNKKYAEFMESRDILLTAFNNSYANHTASIRFGDFTYGTPAVSTWGEGARLIIGKFCSIAGGVHIMLGGEHRTDWVTTYPFNAFINSFNYIKGHPMSKGDVTIGNDVWIGSNVKIMSGVTIGDGCVIGANALVTKDCPVYSIVGGVPAKVIKYRFDQKIITTLMEIKWWEWSYEDIVEVIPLLQSNNFNSLFKYYSEHIKKEFPTEISVIE